MNFKRPLLICLLCFIAAPPVSAHDEPDPLSFFFQQRNERAIQSAQELLLNSETEAASRNRALAALACIHLVEGRRGAATAAFDEILIQNPLYNLPEIQSMPGEVVDAFYKQRDSRLLSQGAGGQSDIQTLAVGEIENNSILKGQFDLDHFARGLSQIIMSDLGQATSLTLVDRRRLDTLRREIALNQMDISDPAYRVPMGRLTGAHSYLFGSLFQVKSDRIRLDLRWVETATGEILLSEGRDHKLKSSKDLLKLEQIVLMDLLLPKLEALLDSRESVRDDLRQLLRDKERRLGDGLEYLELVLKTGEAVLAEERGEYREAYAAWARVRQLDPRNSTAAARMQGLRVWIDQMGSE